MNAFNFPNCLMSYVIGSFAVSTCRTSVFLMVFVSRTTSEFEYGIGDEDVGMKVLVTVVVVVTTSFSKSSLPISYEWRENSVLSYLKLMSS
jgi:hypothetical protein